MKEILRLCYKCKEEKPISQFNKNGKGTSIRRSCKNCTRKANKKSKRKEGFYSSSDTMDDYGFREMNKWNSSPFINHVQHLKIPK